MCGIFGLAAKNNKYRGEETKKIIAALFKLSESRGKEAAGLAVRRSDSVDILRLPIAASLFLKSRPFKEFFGKVIESQKKGKPLTFIGHSRLVTHGVEDFNNNNQPVIKDGAVSVHNGIITNDKELWTKFPNLKREFKVDTEVFLALLQMFVSETGSFPLAARKLFAVIEGSASAAVLFDDKSYLFLATNTGSLYVCQSESVFVFASERYILQKFVRGIKQIEAFDEKTIKQVLPNTAILIDLESLALTEFSFSSGEADTPMDISLMSHPKIKIIDHFDRSDFAFTSIVRDDKKFKLLPEIKESMTRSWQGIYGRNELKRCTKCLLPETMTFISFDDNGVCSYCRNFQMPVLRSHRALEEKVAGFRKKNGQPDCLVPFSGGRDSSYGLHYIKNVLKMNPIAYTYDWGVLTDLGRRNAARVCGKLGVEQIIISADIRKKRCRVRKNIEVWLRRPNLGMVPLFMAGDKEFLYHTRQLKKKTGIELSILSTGSGLEDDLFKIGLAGVRLDDALSFRFLSLKDKIQLMKYYGLQYLLNPRYINGSVLDTLFAYYSVFLLSDQNVHFFEYIQWDEDKIISTLTEEYNWEIEKDTKATWRIDDGTAPFYNYIYMTAGGFTEFDTFRSAQIRQGQIDRQTAYELIKEENKPRFESLEWYARTIGFDVNKAIRVINSMPKFY